MLELKLQVINLGTQIFCFKDKVDQQGKPIYTDSHKTIIDQLFQYMVKFTLKQFNKENIEQQSPIQLILKNKVVLIQNLLNEKGNH